MTTGPVPPRKRTRIRGSRRRTPTYASWLNQVELWFAKVKRDLLARGIFTSVTDLARKLRRFITKSQRTRKAGPVGLC